MLSLQRENRNIFTLKCKIETFKKKLNIKIQRAENDSFIFSFTDVFLASNDVKSDVTKLIIPSDLIILMKKFQKHFLSELDSGKPARIQNSSIVSDQSIKRLPLNSQPKFVEF